MGSYYFYHLSAEISISPDSLDFTIEPPEYEESQTITISNTGDDTLEVSLYPGTVTDIDGNVYETVPIGNQLWMAENMKVTHYRNGDPIPNVTDNTQWTNLSTGAYCYYDNDPDNADTYGALYNWYAVEQDSILGLAPNGWHVPTDDEWQTLVDYLGGSGVAGGKMKSTGTIESGNGLWYAPNTGATNESGFSALPGGYRVYGNGGFYGVGNGVYFWSSSEYSSNNAWNRELLYNSSEVIRYYYNKRLGFCIRCIRDSDNLTIRQFDTFDEQRQSAHDEKNERNGWLTYTPTVLSIAPGACEDVTVTVNADSMQEGIYAESITVSSNDPVHPLLTIPVTMSINGVNAQFTADPTEGSAPLEVTFTDSSTDQGTSITSWYWSFGDGVDTTYTTYQDTIEHTYYEVGTYDVSLVVSDGTISDTLTIEDYITVRVLPQISISPDSLDFTIEPPEYEESQIITISNIGDDTLEVSLYQGTVTDIDGNVYQTVKIGNQLWMEENLKVTHYRNGDAIPNETDCSQWTNLSTGAYCYMGNDHDNAATYGALYNWYAVEQDSILGLAPEGWHIPSDTEIMELEMYLGMSSSQVNSTGLRGSNEGSKLAGGYGLWVNGNLRNDPAFGSSGFDLIPGGSRGSYYGYFYNMSYCGSFWSSTEQSNFDAWLRCVINDYTGVDRGYYSKQDGSSVRCVRDNEKWLTYTHTVLSIASGTSEDVTVTVNADSMQAGIYAESITVSSNDPVHSLLTIPVTMSVIQISVDNQDEHLPEKLYYYPNPVKNNDTTINVCFSLIKNCIVSIDLYNIRGQHIETFINEEKNIGEYVVTKDVSKLSSGIYFMKFNIDGKTKAVNKFVLMK